MFLKTNKNASRFIEDALIEKIDREAREKIRSSSSPSMDTRMVGTGDAQNPKTLTTID
jgi:hypothetical protein